MMNYLYNVKDTDFRGVRRPKDQDPAQDPDNSGGGGDAKAAAQGQQAQRVAASFQDGGAGGGGGGLQVIGAGFGRTGTASLFVALNQLGFKTHHMIQVMTRPGQARAWLHAARDRAAGRPINWRKVLDGGAGGGYTAAVDWPAAGFYRELMAAYPDAVVVLTLRDFDKWYESAQGTIFAIRDVARSIRPPLYLAPLFREHNDRVTMTEELIWRGAFGGRFEDREHARRVYEAHVAEVRRIVPPGRLLEFRVQEGWGPLCAFLGKPVPEQPFPHANDTEDFQRRIEHMRAVSRRLAVLFAGCNAVLALTVVAAASVVLLWHVTVCTGRGEGGTCGSRCG